MNFAAIGAVLEGLNKVNGHFTPASVQAIMYHMRSCLQSVESSIIHNKDQCLIMLTLGCMDLIDRIGVLTDEGCEFKSFLSRMVDEMQAAQSTVPDEISHTLLEMQQTYAVKREQAQEIMDIQLGEDDGMNSVLDVLNSRLTVPASTVDEAVAWILRADSSRMGRWVNALAKIESKVAVWNVNEQESVEQVTRQLESMKNRALMQHAHRDQKSSSSETFLGMLKNDVAGNPFSTKYEHLHNVALYAGANPKRDEKSEQVKALMLSTIRNDRLKIDMPALTLPTLKAVGLGHGWITNDPGSYTPILVDESRTLTDDEKRRLSVKDQAVFLCLHERARRSFDPAAATKYESLRDAYVTAARRRRSLYESKKRQAMNRVAAMGTLVGDDVVNEIRAVLDDTFQISDSSQDVGGLLPAPGNAAEDTTELAACTAYINRSTDKADEERFDAVIRARTEELRQSSNADSSASLFQGAKAMLGYIYPNADVVQTDSLMEKFAASQGSPTKE